MAKPALQDRKACRNAPFGPHPPIWTPQSPVWTRSHKTTSEAHKPQFLLTSFFLTCLLALHNMYNYYTDKVEILIRVYTESAIKEAITKSLKGSAAKPIRSLGPLASVAEILISMKGKYGVAASYDSLIKDYYTLVQKESEKVPQIATMIEIKLSSIKWRFPQRFVGNIKSNALRDRLFFSLKKEIRDSIRFR